MNLNVVYTGGSNTLMYSDIVVVRKKPGPLNVNNISDYLLTYEVSEIKEGKLRPTSPGAVDFFIYDLNDNKPMTYDLLIYVSTPVSLDGTGLPSNQLEGIGYIELTEIGLATPDTHEIIKIQYNLIEGVDYNTRLVLDYTQGIVNNFNYLTEESNSDFRSYRKSYISKNINLSPELVSTIETYGSNKTVAPTYKGYIYDKDYYELESLDLDLLYGVNQITSFRVQFHKGDYWLEVNYSNKETILHNISSVPKSMTPLIDLANDPSVSTTKLVNWQFATSIYINPTNTCYRSNPLGTWYLTKTDYSPTDKLNNVYRDRLNSDLSPGLIVGNYNSKFVFSREGNTIVDWCLNKEVRDRLKSLNTYATNTNTAFTVWENSPLKSYKLLETDLETFVIQEYNSTANLIKVYFPDKTTYTFNSTNTKFKILGNGELMIRTSYGFNLYQGSVNKVKEVESIFDLVEVYFSTFDRPLDSNSVDFDTTLIHSGKFYILDNNYKLK
jgi:hypothetical protein